MKKGLQKLNDDDFRDHHLYELLREKGPAERIGEAIFHDRMKTITPFPAGRVEGSSPLAASRDATASAAKPQAAHPAKPSSSSARTRTTT